MGTPWVTFTARWLRFWEPQWHWSWCMGGLCCAKLVSNIVMRPSGGFREGHEYAISMQICHLYADNWHGFGMAAHVLQFFGILTNLELVNQLENQLRTRKRTTAPQCREYPVARLFTTCRTRTHAYYPNVQLRLYWFSCPIYIITHCLCLSKSNWQLWLMYQFDQQFFGGWAKPPTSSCSGWLLLLVIS